jgi:hypothetical protein
VTPAPLIGCAYPLDATVEELMAAGFRGRLALSNADQTASYTIQGGIATSANYGATSGAARTMDFSTGKTAVEFAVTTPASIVYDASDISILSELYTFDLTHSIGVAVGCRTAEGTSTYTLRVNVDGSFVHIDLGIVSPISCVAIMLDADAGVVTVYVNGSPVSLSSSAVTPAAYGVLVQCQEDSNIDPADIGKIFSMTLRSSAADMTTVFPPGTRDACGNLIGG